MVRGDRFASVLSRTAWRGTQTHVLGPANGTRSAPTGSNRGPRRPWACGQSPTVPPAVPC